MTTLRSLSVLCALALLSGPAAAQPGPTGEKPAAEEKAEAEPAKGEQKAEGEAAEDEAAEGEGKPEGEGAGENADTKPKASESNSIVPEEEAAQEEPPVPAPAEPKPGDQSPRPYLKEPEPIGPARALEIGPEAGLWYRTASDGDGVSYGPGFAVGGFARVSFASWLGFRVFYRRGWHPVSVDDGAFGLATAGFPDAQIDQSALDSTALGARFEPTWRLGPVLSLWAGAGAAWVRVEQEPPTTTNPRLRMPYRAGVGVELSGSLGVSLEVVRDWVVLGAHGEAGFVTNQSGDLFETRQAIDLDTGERLFLHGLPELGASLGGFVTVGLLL